MTFESLTPAPADPILGLTEAFKKDTNPRKVNLGVGVYVDENGQTPILETVKQAEAALQKSEKSKSYLGIAGDASYGDCVQRLLFGEKHTVLSDARTRTAHTPGGTGGLRVGAEFLRLVNAEAKVWVSAPTWANHHGIFSAAGFRTHEYPYYKAAGRVLDFEAMCAALEAVPAGDIVLLHVCCHNPTGVDPTEEQWRKVAQIAAARGWIPFFDFAYQGFGAGIVEDRAALLPFAEAGIDFLVASSFSKNFGLYCERVGALTVAAKDSAAAEAALSHVKVVVRRMYSNPPGHGGRIVTHIMKDAALRAQWERELAVMRNRINGVRSQFVKSLHARSVAMDFSFIEHQRGMFSFSGLTDHQVKFLKDSKAIYMVGGGRMNVAGMTPSNMDYVCDSIAEALKL
jgi:aspartate/tyrosine/aromatic aminotransferase